MAMGLEQIVTAVEGLGVMPRAELVQLSGEHQLEAGDSAKLLKLLVKRGVLTRFQANALHHGLVKALTIGEYLVLDKLGSGGMGDVYKAQHRRMKRVVAIKLLPAAATRNPQMVRRFYREVEAAGKLIHPNIVTAYDAGEHHGVHYLVMEYVQGGDLGSRVKESGPLPLKQAVHCILQAAQGLAYAHQHGVIHRDIKPANLILADDGVVKILDMGLARIEQEAAQQEHSLTGDGTMGTPDYMAPEQALNAKHADHRSDIYSLGCTLYRIATGSFPFAGATLMEKLMAQREAPPPSLTAAVPECPPRLEQVFQTMLAKQPEHRFQSMQEVVAELEQCVTLLSASPVESDLAALAMAMSNANGAAAIPMAGPVSTSAAREPSSLMTLEPTGQAGATLMRLHDKAAGTASPRRFGRPLLMAVGVLVVLLLGGVVTLWPGDGDHAALPVRPNSAGAAATTDDLKSAVPERAAIMAASSRTSRQEPAPIEPAYSGPDDPSQWRFSRAERLPSPINTQKMEKTPWISPDGLTLWFNSPGPGSNMSLWTTRRQSEDARFGPPTPVNSPTPGSALRVSLNGQRLIAVFYDTAPGRNDWDLWMRQRPALGQPFGEPVNLGPHVNTEHHEVEPTLSLDGLTLIFGSNRPGGRGGDLWISRRGSLTESFGPPENLGPVVNSDSWEGGPWLSPDGLLLLFHSGRPGTIGGMDIWMSRRRSRAAAFGEPVNLGPAINTPALEHNPTLSADGTLVFESDRDSGNFDLWISRVIRGDDEAAGASLGATVTLPPNLPRPEVTGEVMPVLKGVLAPNPSTPVERIVGAPDGDLIAVVHGGDKPAVRLWRLSSWKHLSEWPAETSGIAAIAFAWDSQTMGIAEADKPVIRLMNTANGKQRWVVPIQGLEKITAMAMSNEPVKHSERNIIAAAGDRNTIVIKDLGRQPRRDVRQSAVWWPKDLQFLPGSHQFVVTGLTDGPGGKAEVWDSHTSQPLFEIAQQRGMSQISMTADGARFITGSGNFAHVVDLKSRAVEPKFRASDGGFLHDAAIHPSSRLALTVAPDHTVRLWAMSSSEPREISRITRPEGTACNSATFIGDGRRFAIAWDYAVLIFETPEIVAEAAQ